MTDRRLKHWGWGFEDQQPTPAALRTAAAGLAQHLGLTAGDMHIEDPLPLSEVHLAPVRIAVPSALAPFCTDSLYARAAHALGKSYCDVLAGFRGHFHHPPDFVAHPRDERELECVLEWCSSERVAVIPFGGGTSVVGGVRPQVPAACNGVISLDMAAFDRVLEVDPISRSARIQAGARGPALESQLAEHGFTLRHYPQSFEYSTLGGWLATRAGGHFATLFTHIDDFLQSIRAITPASGVWQSRRLPASGAGPSPDRLLLGSEGVLGVITEAWLRVLPKPLHRRSAAVGFARFSDGVECARALAQSGLHPANCRLIDPAEARLTLAGDGSLALLLVAFESAQHPVDFPMTCALDICREHGGEVSERPGGGGGRPSGGDGGPGGGDGGAVGTWRQAFLGAPYMRDVFVAMGLLTETFETAITWERFPAFNERVVNAAHQAIADSGHAAGEGGLAGEGGFAGKGGPAGWGGLAGWGGPAGRGGLVSGSGGHVSCRFTHVYPDGPAPYYTVLAPARRGEEIEQWQAIKRAVSDVIIAEGATITHHHAVGRDHRPWYDQQRPEPFAIALSAAKAALDPAAIMNPGVLVGPLS